MKQCRSPHPTSPSLGHWLAVTLFFTSKLQVRDRPKWFKVTNSCHSTIYCSSTLLPVAASTSENATLAMELASRMKVPTTTSWLSMPKSFYKKPCYNTLNNPYWDEKGLAASFNSPQHILTCQRNCSYILKQTELLSVHWQFHGFSTGSNRFRHFMILNCLEVSSLWFCIYMWDISLCSTLFHSLIFESVTPFSEWFYLLSVNNCEIWVEA